MGPVHPHLIQMMSAFYYLVQVILRLLTKIIFGESINLFEVYHYAEYNLESIKNFIVITQSQAPENSHFFIS